LPGVVSPLKAFLGSDKTIQNIFSLNKDYPLIVDYQGDQQLDLPSEGFGYNFIGEIQQGDWIQPTYHLF